jgi:nitrogen-specific signal transduction histidine kinase
MKRKLNNQRKIKLNALEQTARQDQSSFIELVVNSLESLPQGIILIDRNGLVVAFNNRAQTSIGIDAEEVIGKYYLWDFWKGEEFADYIKQTILEGKPLPEGSKPKAKYNINFAPCYDEANSFLGGMVHVIYGNEFSPLNLPQNTGKPQGVGRIISAIAHEINNPLQTIRTSLELSQNPKKNADRRLNYLQAANNEINRIVQIINQMRKFYRPVSGEKIATDVNSTLQEALQLLATSLEEVEISVNLHLAGNLPPVALLSYQLEQVFLYLMLQALEIFTSHNNLFIQTAQLEDGYIAINFSDKELHGIPTRQPQPGKEPVFDPFHSGKQGGLGLGLLISQEIIKELGGYLQSGEGFSLTVYLPY